MMYVAAIITIKAIGITAVIDLAVTTVIIIIGLVKHSFYWIFLFSK